MLNGLFVGQTPKHFLDTTKANNLVFTLKSIIFVKHKFILVN